MGPGEDGAIFAVDEHGRKTQLDLPPGTLLAPGGITVDEDGARHVTNLSVAAGDGEVLRITADASSPDGDDDEDDDENDDGDDRKSKEKRNHHDDD